MVEAISVVVIGARKSGKTAAAARLCHLLGGFSEDYFAECKELAKALADPACADAWLLDTLGAEREQGHTFSPKVGSFRSASFRYTIIDTPGHPLLKGSLGALNLADVALLCISGADGEFEAEVETGRTKELVLACFTMGVKEVVVVVTKMDVPSVNYSQPRFEEIKKVVSGYLKEVGYKQKEAWPFVPVSGIVGDNLIQKSDATPWYSGSLIATLDALGPFNRPAEKPLRLPVLRVRNVPDVGTVVLGRIETGSLKPGMKVLLGPGGHVAEVRSLRIGAENVSEGKPGDVVSCCLGEGTAVDTDLRIGTVLSPCTGDPACECETLLAQVIILDHPGTIRAGYCPSIAVGTIQVPCEFEELVSKLDRKTGKELEKSPESAKANEMILAKLRPRAAACIEVFAAFPSLGRFAVRDHGRTVAIGVVKEVTKRPVPKVRSEGDSYFNK